MSGGSAVVGDDVVTVAGIREPGLDQPSRTSGVYLFSLRRPGDHDDHRGGARAGARAFGLDRAGGSQECVGTAVLRAVHPHPAARRPHPVDDPARHPRPVAGRGEGAGPRRARGMAAPGQPRRRGGRPRVRRVHLRARRQPARAGSSACSTRSLSCTSSAIPRPGAAYNRITLLAVNDTTQLPEHHRGRQPPGRDPGLQPAARGPAERARTGGQRHGSTDARRLRSRARARSRPRAARRRRQRRRGRSGADTTPTAPQREPADRVQRPGQQPRRVSAPSPRSRSRPSSATTTTTPNGLDINAQICFFPDGSRRFIAGEDTDQPDPPPGWGIFELNGDRSATFKATQVGKLVPTYQAASSNAENYGCGFLATVGSSPPTSATRPTGDGDGQLIVWFPPFDSRQVRYCKIDVAIATAGRSTSTTRIASTSRRPGRARPSTGVLRYTGPFPTSDDAAGGCGKKDATGAPLADAVSREQLHRRRRPRSSPRTRWCRRGRGGFYVSSVFNGVIAEFDADGKFVRTVLTAPRRRDARHAAVLDGHAARPRRRPRRHALLRRHRHRHQPRASGPGPRAPCGASGSSTASRSPRR